MQKGRGIWKDRQDITSKDRLKPNLDEELTDRLDELARKYSRRSGATVAAEVVTDYVDFWEEVEKERLALKERQRKAVTAESRRRG